MVQVCLSHYLSLQLGQNFWFCKVYYLAHSWTTNKKLFPHLLDFVLKATFTPTPLFLMDNIKLDKLQTKIKWKIHACCFKLAFTAADIIFRTSHNISEKKKDFCNIFSFFNRFILTLLLPLNDKNPLRSVAKVFCRCFFTHAFVLYSYIKWQLNICVAILS